jgi:hypothetical protein
VSADERIWIGQDGEKYGPYSEDDIREWLREGRITTAALAWREGMADWAPLGSFFAAATGSMPPPPPGMPPLAPHPPWTNRTAGQGPFAPGSDAVRATLPEPPSLHWGLVLLFAVLTIGLFGIFWAFHQAAWTRRIDPKSNATLMLGLSLACFLIGEPLYFIGIFTSIGTNHPNMDLISLGGILLLGRFILSQIAYFSMADSLKRDLAKRGVKLEIGGITLFFFTLFYLQSNLSWTARWKQTGQTKPKPSKGILWLIFFVLPFVLGILFGLGITAYQGRAGQPSLGDASPSPAQIVASTKQAQS